MPPVGPIKDADFEPIGDVSLEKYVEISKGYPGMDTTSPRRPSWPLRASPWASSSAGTVGPRFAQRRHHQLHPGVDQRLVVELTGNT